MELKQRITQMAGLMSVSGFETYDRAALFEQLGDIFDEVITDPMGSYICIRRCGRPGAPKILIDAHFDEIGMMVTEILEGGFLKVTGLGGLDTRILQAGEVIIYGEKPIFGIVGSTPPHLQKPDEAKKLKPIDELFIDTGYDKAELEKFVRLGTPVGFLPVYTELLGGKLAGKGFDNKSCAAVAVHALAGMDRSAQAGDVYLLLASQEEVGCRGGQTGAAGIDPDYAMVLDVAFGADPDTKKTEAFPLGDGATISLSAATDLRLTRRTLELAREAGIKFTRVVEGSNTGTDADVTQLVCCGIPTVLAGLPLRSMHTYNEVLSLSDAEELAKLVAAFVGDARIAEDFAR